MDLKITVTMMVMSSQCLDQPVRLSKLFLKKAPQLWAKTSPGSSMGVDPPRQKLAPQHGRDTCTFNGAKLPPRATHSTQDGEGCLCNFVLRLSLDEKLTGYVAHEESHEIFQTILYVDVVYFPIHHLLCL